MGTIANITAVGSTLDSASSLATDLAAFNKNPGDNLLQAKVNADIQNLGAAASAVFLGVGASTAFTALTADLTLIGMELARGVAPTSSDGLAVLGNMLTIVGQVVAVAGLSEIAITGGIGVVPGVAVITLGGAIDLIGAGITAGSIGVDFGDISENFNALASALKSLQMNLSSDYAGMAVPQVNSLGEVVGFTMENPTSVVNQSDGSQTLYFSGNISVVIPSSSNSASPSVWTIPQPGTNSTAQICTYADGSYKYSCVGVASSRTVSGSSDSVGESSVRQVITYDLSGNITQTDNYTYAVDASGAVTATTDMTYDANGALVSGTTTQDDGSSVKTEYNSPTDQQLTTVTYTNADGTIEQIATTTTGNGPNTYDTTITNGNGNILSTKIYVGGVLVSKSNYDASGLLSQEWHYDNTTGRLIKIDSYVNGAVAGEMLVMAGYNDFSVNGTGNFLEANNSSFQMNSGAHLELTGTGDEVSGPGFVDFASSDTTIGEVDATLMLRGTDDTVSLYNGSVTLGSGVAVTIQGAGAGADQVPSGTIDAGDNNSITFSGRLDATVIGGGDTITVMADPFLTVSGDHIAVLATGAAIDGDNNAITATGVDVYISGDNDSLTGGDDRVVGGGSFNGSLTLAGSGYVINATGGTFTLAGGSSATVTGQSNTINVAASAAVAVDQYTGFEGSTTQIYANGASQITLNVGADANVFGSGNTIATIGSNVLLCTDDTVVLTGSGTAVGGSDDTLEAADGLSLSMGANGLTNNGTDNVLVGNDETLSCAGVGVTLKGTGDVVSASKSTLTLLTDESATFKSGGDTINATTGDAVVVDYSSGYGADVINVVGDAAGGVTTDGQATGITLAAQVQATVVGGGDTVTALGSNMIMASGDTLVVSGGGDTVTGNGNTITFGAGVADATINGSREKLILSDPQVTVGSLTVSAGNNGSSLVLTNAAAGVDITLANMLSETGAGAQQLQLADGTVLSALQLVDMETTRPGTNQTLYGWAEGGNVFNSEGGDDLAIGHGNGDTFVFDQGYGQLEINESDSAVTPDDVLQLGGITPALLEVYAEGANVVVTDGMPGDRIQLDGMASGVSGEGVEQFHFDDGTVWDSEQIAKVIAHTIIGTTSGEVLQGTTAGELYDSLGGNNDVEEGLGGNDTFVFHQGYGNLTIKDTYAAGSMPVLELGPGITASNLSASVSTNGQDIILTDGTVGDEITLTGMNTSSNAGVGEVKFADGTTLSAQQLIEQIHTLTGTAANDTLSGAVGAGAVRFNGNGGTDVENGTGGSDTFEFNRGYGNLTVNEIYTTGSTPILELGSGITASNLFASVGANGQDIILTDGAAGDEVTLTGMNTSGNAGIGEIEFADGTTLSAAQLLARAHTLTGTRGNDTLSGLAGAGADLFDGKGGIDVESGTGGSDMFVFNGDYGNLTVSETYVAGSTPVLQLGDSIIAAETEVYTSGSNLVVGDGITGDKVTLTGMAIDGNTGVGEIEFTNGAVWTAGKMRTLAANTLIGTTGADDLQGAKTAEVYDGLGGNDVETGQGGEDTFVFNAGYGKLEIDEWDDAPNRKDVLRLGSGISESTIDLFTEDGSDLLITDGVNGDRIELDGMLSSSQSGIDAIQFDDGTLWTRNQILATAHTDQNLPVQVNGTANSDTLSSDTEQPVIFDGKGGNDIVNGNSENDTFIFNAGYGQLQIDEWDNSANANNVLKLGAGVTESSVSLSTVDNSDIIVTDDVAGDSIEIDGMFSSNDSGVQALQFADGTVWTRSQILARTEIEGSAGTSQTLKGTSDNNVFDSEAGKDREVGNGGGDIYVLKPGYSPITVVNGVSSSNVAAGDLSIQGVNADNIWLQQIGANLQVDIMGSNTTATIDNWFSNAYSQLSELTVSGGSDGKESLSNAQVSQLIQAMTTFAASNSAFNPQAAGNPGITDPTALAAVNTAWHPQ